MASSILRKPMKRDSTIRIKRYLPALEQLKTESTQQQQLARSVRHFTTTVIDKDIGKLFSTLNISRVDSQAENLQCSAHPDENLDFYCTKCEKQCCMECRTADHTDETCNVKPACVVVIDKFTANKESLYCYCKMLTMFMDIYNKEHTGLYEKIEEVLKLMDEVNVKDVESLTVKSESILAELSKKHAVYKSMKAQAITILTAFFKLESLTPSKAMKRLQILEQDIKKLTQTEIALLSWKVEIPNKYLLSSESVLMVDHKTKHAKSGDTVRDIELEYNTRVVGMVKVFNCIVVIHSDNNNICMFSEGECGQKIAVPDMKNPIAMELLSRNNDTATIGVANINKGLLIVLTFNNAMQLTNKEVHMLKFNPTDISVMDSPDTLLITDPENKRLHIYNTSGKEIQVIDIHPSAVSSPVKTATASNGYIVLDFDNNCAVWLDKEGKLIHSYGKSHEGHSLATGTHISVDSFGNTLIADADNHRIHMLDKDGKFLRHILQKNHGIGFPTRLFLDDENNQLYVGHHPRGIENNGSIRIVHYTPVPSTITDIYFSVNIK